MVVTGPSSRLSCRTVETGVQACAQLVGWELGPGSPLTLAVHDDAGGAEHGDDACDTEELGPPHDHLRYGLDGCLDDAA